MTIQKMLKNRKFLYFDTKTLLLFKKGKLNIVASCEELVEDTTEELLEVLKGLSYKEKSYIKTIIKINL